MSKKERGIPFSMELFKLFGTIAVRNSEANNAIDETNVNNHVKHFRCNICPDPNQHSIE